MTTFEPDHSSLDIVYVVGHKNPDTDTICSAIAYAALRRATDLPGAMPARLGPLWAETAAALARLGVEPPLLLADVRQRVADVMNPDVVTAREDDTLYDAARTMREQRKRLLPVVDDARRLRGVLTLDDIAERYLSEMTIAPEGHGPLALDHFLRVSGGTLLEGAVGRHFTGRVWIGAARAETLHARITPGDLVLVGDREDAQATALAAGAAYVIVTGGAPPSAAIRTQARECGAALIAVAQDTYAAARLLNLSLPVSDLLHSPDQTVDPDDLAADAAHILLAPGAGGQPLPVVDDDGRVHGIVSRTDLLRGRRKRVILVDHNQRSQAVDGLDEAELLGVLDHHNLGDLHTAEPVLFVLEPVGCTATIVYELYQRAGLTPDRPIAGLLLAAIISDTLLLTSPTTTARDRAAVAALGPLAGLDPAAFAQELFRARSDFSATTPREIIQSNLKSYEFGGARLAVGQAETLATDYFLDHQDEFLDALARLKEDGPYDYALLLVTDILHGDSLALYPGAAERQLLAGAFALGSDATDHRAALPGIVSRKKQVVPPLARTLAAR